MLNRRVNLRLHPTENNHADYHGSYYGSRLYPRDGSQMTKHLELLVSEIVDYGYSDPMALENTRLKLPLIMEVMQKITNEQRDDVMFSKRVLEHFLNLLKESGDKEIQFSALSILLTIPAVLKFGNWLSYAWFTIESLSLDFLKLLKLHSEKKMYHDFLDALNIAHSSSGLACNVYSWKCSLLVKGDTSGSVRSDETWLNFNLGTRTISFSLEGKDIRVPFSGIEYQEVEVENVKGHELLRLIIQTDSSSYSFLGLQGETRASTFMKSELLQYIEHEKRGSEEDTENEFLDIKPSLSSFQEFTFEHGDLKLSNSRINSGELLTQSVPSNISRNRKSIGLSHKKRGRTTSSDRRLKKTTSTKIQRNSMKTSKKSSGKATSKVVVRRSSRHSAM